MASSNNQRRANGIKIVDVTGVSRISKGIKANANAQVPLESKPDWIRIKLPVSSAARARTEQALATDSGKRLVTVCEQAGCPNLSECWNRGTATFMLLGEVCTRACKFCMVDTGNPLKRTDDAEPLEVAETVRQLQLQYIVLTSVNRDDLDDGGATHFAATIDAIHQLNPQTHVEVLIPDFQGHEHALQKVVDAKPLVIAQNLETVERLTHQVRDIRAGYRQTLDALQFCSNQGQNITKSSLILGLGETESEIKQALNDLRDADVNIVTIGQYLRPSINHLPVAEWVLPEKFDQLRDYGLSIGFDQVVSGPMTRSSYRAEEAVSIPLKLS